MKSLCFFTIMQTDENTVPSY